MAEPQVDSHGNAVALVQKLFLKHSNSIRGFVFALSTEVQLVDDVFHATFLAVTAKAEQYDPELPFVPWARGFAKNELLKMAADRKRAPVLLSPDVIENLHLSAPEFQVGNERISALLACLEKLAPRSKQAIVLRYHESLRPPAIARRMAQAVASVNVMLSKARAALSRCVELKLRTEV